MRGKPERRSCALARRFAKKARTTVGGDQPRSGGVETKRFQSCARTTPARNKDAAGGSAGKRTSRRSRKQGERPRRFVASAAGGADGPAELVDRGKLRANAVGKCGAA